METETVLSGYLACALWTTIGDDDEPLDRTHTLADLAPGTLDTMRADVADFLALCDREGIDLSTIEPEQVGHDFWLTRNGHGAGFWDRGLDELGDLITKWAHTFGESDLYIGDDGQVYVQ